MTDDRGRSFAIVVIISITDNVSKVTVEWNEVLFYPSNDRTLALSPYTAQELLTRLH